MTDPGTVMGTVGYMAPEQVRGQTVDARADLFAFGAVLYEMISGQRAFGRETAADTMTAVLKEDPPELTGTRADISPALDRIIRHCLEKNPSERFQTARDVAFALGSLSGSGASLTSTGTGQRSRAGRGRTARSTTPARAAFSITVAVALVAAAAAVGIDRHDEAGAADGVALPAEDIRRADDRQCPFHARRPEHRLQRRRFGKPAAAVRSPRRRPRTPAIRPAAVASPVDFLQR